MKVWFMIENPDEIEATIKLTMTIKKWTELQDQLRDTYPSWELSSKISEVVNAARKVFYAEGGKN
ncbi:hypothetical protein LCGC14_1690850 [marine sediment metagenome]|uniref:Uncharacterized protein n=1 Tax=marine sediment metagenome TaxID=412755 RepID=A0A0F9HKS7_9ZZZZ